MIQKYFLKISNSLSYHFLRKSAAHLIHFSIIFSTRSTVWFFDCIRQCRHIHTPRNFVARGILIMFLTGPSVNLSVFFLCVCVCMCVCFFFLPFFGGVGGGGQRNSYLTASRNFVNFCSHFGNNVQTRILPGYSDSIIFSGTFGPFYLRIVAIC